MLLIQTAYQKVKDWVCLLWSSYGFWRLHDEANGAGVGLEARRRFCPPRGASGLSAGVLLLTFNIIWRCEPGNQPSNQLRKFEILLSSSCVTNTWKTDIYVSCDARHGFVTTATGWSRPARSQLGGIKIRECYT